MPSSADEVTSMADAGSLAGLLDEVFRTRAAGEWLRRQRGLKPEAMMEARRTSLRALEAYAAALSALRWPIPRSIQQDLQLHRSLCGGPRGRAVRSSD
jgi:hypothetical protein